MTLDSKARTVLSGWIMGPCRLGDDKQWAFAFPNRTAEAWAATSRNSRLGNFDIQNPLPLGRVFGRALVALKSAARACGFPVTFRNDFPSPIHMSLNRYEIHRQELVEDVSYVVDVDKRAKNGFDEIPSLTGKYASLLSNIFRRESWRSRHTRVSAASGLRLRLASRHLRRIMLFRCSK
jgi:hypothetical protein